LSVRRPLSRVKPERSAPKGRAADSVEDEMARAWSALLAVRRAQQRSAAPAEPERASFGLDSKGRLFKVPEGSERCLLLRDASGWRSAEGVSAAARALFDLYLPVCNASAASPMTVAHLGQSLDGYIA